MAVVAMRAVDVAMVMIMVVVILFSCARVFFILCAHYGSFIVTFSLRILTIMTAIIT